MKQITDNLYQSKFDFPFGKSEKGPSCESAAYLLAQESGNILFYSSRYIEDDFDFIADKGGLSVQLLNHRDEASSYSDKVMEKFGAPLMCHTLEKTAVEKESQVGKTLSGGEVFGNVTAIHTPGHCPGSVCFFSNQKTGSNILFTGDTFYPCQRPDGIQWRVTIRDKKQEEMIRSLGKLRELTAPLTVVPSLFIGDRSYETFEEEKWRFVIDGCISRLKQEETH